LAVRLSSTTHGILTLGTNSATVIKKRALITSYFHSYPSSTST
jgi:hypothetical protein